VDFSEARPSDPAWWRWLHSRLDLLERRNLVRLYELQHAQNVAVLPVVTAEGVKEHWERANGLLVKAFNRLFPWMREEESDEPSFEESASELNRLWSEAFGDPNDPETQKRIWATAAALDPALAKG